ncbi:hypothetical protein H4219_002308 [Mycoemilia scoparia]|uniref:Sodium/potassium exporting P-type ATPase 1 n=1 Tax=Mycoemilia scoparia TaxID=417184 RepID=A0A9W7ZXZ4_9FUNG|nr:hypothetical protein H4219_002308 [Mycoemilia scoparia]
MSTQEVLGHFTVETEIGLTPEDVLDRRAEHGTNELKGDGGVSALTILFRQIANIMTLILMAAFIVSFVVKDFVEGAVICLVILTNVTIGFFQEFKAEKTMESLRKMTSPTCRVLRDGHQTVVPTMDLVPGDIVFLQMGDVVGADCRLFEVFNLEADEALLTGETLPVEKEIETIDDTECPLGDRINMCFSSTTITKGRGKGIVCCTGMSSEVGRIAKKLMDTKPAAKTPLQKGMYRMSWVLLGIAILLIIIVFAANKFKINTDVALYAISLAIATIPSGMIAVVTLTMALAVRQLTKQRALVRQLVALENLGSVTHICSDKTGTLTQSKMVLVRAWLPGCGYHYVGGIGFEPVGDVRHDPQEGNALESKRRSQIPVLAPEDFKPSFKWLAQAASLCNMSEIKQDQHTDEWFGIGDPTEIALQVFASKLKMGKPALTGKDGSWTLVSEFPFDSAIKRMSVIARHGELGEFVFTKGATERIVQRCTAILQSDGQHTPISQTELLDFLAPVVDEMARDGLRVLSLAYRPLKDSEDSIDDASNRDSVEKDLVFIGLAGIYDPPRPESLPSVETCYQAGIAVTMLTGDHPATARSIAHQVGILPNIDSEVDEKNKELTSEELEMLKPTVMTAKEFDAMTEEEIDALPHLPNVIARCSPDTKVKMIEALHRRGAVVGMTGDGTNDSPSLKLADIGVAMGTGSDVAKQASEIILTDDNFATIVTSIREGRRVFNNLQRCCMTLISGNVGEVVPLIIGLAFRDSAGHDIFPLSPVAILVNLLLTSTPPAVAIGMEKAAPDLMDQPPRSKSQGLYTKEAIVDIAYYGFVVGLLGSMDFWLALDVVNGKNQGIDCNEKYSEECDKVFRARGCLFTTLTILIILLTFNFRHLRRRLWFSMSELKRCRDNRFLLYGSLVGIIIAVLALYIPGLNTAVFKHKGIGWEWGLVIKSIFVFIVLSDLWKTMKSHFYRPMLIPTPFQKALQTYAQKRCAAVDLNTSLTTETLTNKAKV